MPGKCFKIFLIRAVNWNHAGIFKPKKETHAVTEEWFWHSIRIEARVGETSYRPSDLDPISKTPNQSIGSIER